MIKPGTKKAIVWIRSMSVEPSHYEEILARLSRQQDALVLLKQHQAYLKLLPRVRRPEASIIPVPLPTVQIRRFHDGMGDPAQHLTHELVSLPCDLAYLMYDPEWQVKVGVEIFIFIQRAEENFSQLLGRWRQTQVTLSPGYSWQFPPYYKQFSGESAERIFPLFVLFADTPEHIKSGLQSSALPFVIPEADFDQAGQSSPATILDGQTQESC